MNCPFCEKVNIKNHTPEEIIRSICDKHKSESYGGRFCLLCGSEDYTDGCEACEDMLFRDSLLAISNMAAQGTGRQVI